MNLLYFATSFYLYHQSWRNKKLSLENMHRCVSSTDYWVWLTMLKRIIRKFVDELWKCVYVNAKWLGTSFSVLTCWLVV